MSKNFIIKKGSFKKGIMVGLTLVATIVAMVGVEKKGSMQAEAAAISFRKSIKKCEVILSPDEIFATGKRVCPEVKVEDEGITLAEGIDYTLEYKNNIEVGDDACVKIKGIGKYRGKLKEEFELQALDISTCSAQLLNLFGKEEVHVQYKDQTIDKSNYMVDILDVDKKELYRTRSGMKYEVKTYYKITGIVPTYGELYFTHTCYRYGK